MHVTPLPVPLLDIKNITSFYKSKIVIFSLKTFFSNFSSYTSKIKNAVFSFGYTSVYSASFVHFNFVKNDDNYKVPPELTVSEIILSELQIKAFVFSNLIPKDQYMH